MWVLPNAPPPQSLQGEIVSRFATADNIYSPGFGCLLGISIFRLHLSLLHGTCSTLLGISSPQEPANPLHPNKKLCWIITVNTLAPRSLQKSHSCGPSFTYRFGIFNLQQIAASWHSTTDLLRDQYWICSTTSGIRGSEAWLCSGDRSTDNLENSRLHWPSFWSSRGDPNDHGRTPPYPSFFDSPPTIDVFFKDINCSLLTF